VTLVAGFMVNKWPLLIGDMLLSSPVIPGEAATLPGLPTLPETAEVSWPEDLEYAPKGLCQKLTVIADNLAIGCSGKRACAMDVIGELRQRYADGPLDFDVARDYFHGKPASVWQEIGITGFASRFDESGLPEFCIFGWGCKGFESPTFGPVRTIGTGMNAVQEQLLLNSDCATPGNSGLDFAQFAVSFGLSLTGGLLNKEVHTGSTLAEFFGGGYELVTFSGGKFHKLGDVLNLFWTVRAEKDGIRLTPYPFRAIRFAYQNELLIVRSSEIRDCAIHSDVVFSVPPVYRYLNADEKASPPIPSLNCPLVCNYILQLAPTGELQSYDILTFIERCALGVPLVRLEEMTDGLQFAVKPEFYQRLYEYVAQQKLKSS
jgi:hypothetical protein